MSLDSNMLQQKPLDFVKSISLFKTIAQVWEKKESRQIESETFESLEGLKNIFKQKFEREKFENSLKCFYERSLPKEWHSTGVDFEVAENIKNHLKTEYHRTVSEIQSPVSGSDEANPEVNRASEFLNKNHYQPSGQILFIVDFQSPFYLWTSVLLKSLLNKNRLIIFIPSINPKSLETDSEKEKNFYEHIEALRVWSNECQKKQIPLFIFSGNEDLLELMLSHPSIDGIVSWSVNPMISETLNRPLVTQQLIRKKLQMTQGRHNAALILPDADLKLAASEIFKAFWIENDFGLLNVTEVFITESYIEEFMGHLSAIIESVFSTSGDFEKSKEGRDFLDSEVTSSWKNRLKSEPGNYVESFLKVGVHLVRDFSHCSELHQSHVVNSTVMIQPVKYLHEMSKWVKTFEHGGCAFIFGSSEKIEKIGATLPVQMILKNSWTKNICDIPAGRGRSFIGISDYSLRGSFYCYYQCQ